jgi:hypothetical protein
METQSHQSRRWTFSAADGNFNSPIVSQSHQSRRWRFSVADGNSRSEMEMICRRWRLQVTDRKSTPQTSPIEILCHSWRFSAAEETQGIFCNRISGNLLKALGSASTIRHLCCQMMLLLLLSVRVMRIRKPDLAEFLFLLSAYCFTCPSAHKRKNSIC